VALWSAIALPGIYPQNTKILIQRVTCPNVYSSIIYNSQTMEAAQVSIHWGMNKEDVFYIHNAILFSHKEEWNLIICNEVGGAREYYARWNKSEKDKYHMISLICGI